jgi:streptogramin lyase
MRLLFGLVATLALISRGVASPPEDKNSKPAKSKISAVAPRVGIKTPGVQIPFARLKAEAQFETPEKPGWIFVATPPIALYPGKDVIGRIDPKTNKTVDPIAGLSKPCGGMASAFGSLWTPVCGTASLARIDAKTLKATATIATGTSSAAGIVASSSDSIWLLTDDKTTLSRIDPEQNAVVGELRVPAGCHSLTFGETALWLACPAQNKVLRINPATNLVEKSIEVSAQPEALTAGEGSIWVLCRKDGKVDRIDPKTNKVSKTIDLEVPGASGGISFGEGSLWITQAGFPLTRIDVAAESVAQQFPGEGGGAIAWSAGAIWLSNLDKGTVWRIDPKLVLAMISE